MVIISLLLFCDCRRLFLVNLLNPNKSESRRNKSLVFDEKYSKGMWLTSHDFCLKCLLYEWFKWGAGVCNIEDCSLEKLNSPVSSKTLDQRFSLGDLTISMNSKWQVCFSHKHRSRGCEPLATSGLCYVSNMQLLVKKYSQCCKLTVNSLLQAWRIFFFLFWTGMT